MKINTEIITALKPCKDSFDNYLKHYKDFAGTHEDFVELREISRSDKLWVLIRLMPRFEVEVFAIDCAVAAAASAVNATDYATERERQIEALIYLINNMEEEA